MQTKNYKVIETIPKKQIPFIRQQINTHDLSSAFNTTPTIEYLRNPKLNYKTRVYRHHSLEPIKKQLEGYKGRVINMN